MTDADLIAAHIAKHGITRCPPKTFAMPTVETWKEMAERNAAVLRRRRKFAAAKARAIELSARPRRRLDLDAIVALIRDGKTIRETAEAMDTTAESISAKLKRAKLTVAKIRQAEIPAQHHQGAEA